jgi:hypothetical protein
MGNEPVIKIRQKKGGDYGKRGQETAEEDEKAQTQKAVGSRSS